MKTLLLSILLIVPIILFSQNYTLQGAIVNESNVPLEAVACVLKNMKDTLVFKSTMSDKQGQFTFVDLVDGEYILSLKHMAYANEVYNISIAGSNQNLPPFVLLSNDNKLNEVVVSAERPVMKASEGKLIFDAPLLVKDKVVTNALDVLKNIPNIMSSGGDDIQLVGTDNFTILLNGQPSSMNMDQLKTLLKSMPASQVANIEVMYSAPPQYNVRGAAINVILVKSTDDMPALQGEGRLEYTQKTYAAVSGNANLMYHKDAFNASLMVNLNRSKNKSTSHMYGLHHYDGHVYDITQNNRGLTYGSEQSFRLGLDYSLKNKDKFQLVYTGNFDSEDGRPVTNTIFLEDGNPFTNIDSRSNNSGNTYLHNIKAEFNSHAKLNIGADYTFYRDPQTEIYRDFSGETALNPYKTKTIQNINNLQFFANHSITIGDGWKMDYGGKFTISNNNNGYDYFTDPDSNHSDSVSNSKQKEQNAILFAGLSKSLTDKLSIQASLSGNYFHATFEQMDSKKTLWDDFQPFVNANATYRNTNTLYQFSFSSDVSYPPYWAMSSNVSRINAYSIARGNPELKFAKSYKAQFLFMLLNKYMLIASYRYVSDRYIQLPYQSQTSLQNEFQMINLDYDKTYSASFIVPFRLGKILSSRLSFTLFRQEEKDTDFYDIPFERTKNTYTTQLTNTVNISEKIKLDISGFYMNGAIQGIYDIGRMYNVDAGVKWQFLDDNAELAFRVGDVFKTAGSKTKIDYGSQYNTMKIMADSPSFLFAFTYRFGKYKKTKTDEVDKSRYGR